MWKPIKEWENLYCVNENGEVLSIKTNKLIKGDINSCGYYRVCLYDIKNNRKKRYFRHRLVATHFISNPNDYTEVNHIDGNKSNNSIENLEWISRKQNERHCRKEIHSKEYKPYRVVFCDGKILEFDFKSDLSEVIGVTTSCIRQWLHKETHGYKKYGIASIEYI